MIGHITETYTTAARRHCHHSEYVLRTDVRSQEGNEISNEESIESSLPGLPRAILYSSHASSCENGVLPSRLRRVLVYSHSHFFDLLLLESDAHNPYENASSHS